MWLYGVPGSRAPRSERVPSEGTVEGTSKGVSVREKLGSKLSMVRRTVVCARMDAEYWTTWKWCLVRYLMIKFNAFLEGNTSLIKIAEKCVARFCLDFAEGEPTSIGGYWGRKMAIYLRNQSERPQVGRTMLT